VRTFVSAVATLLAVLLAAVAVPAIWLERTIVQEEGFVGLAAPLGTNAEFQQRLAAAAVGTIDTSAVPGIVSELVNPVLADAATSLTSLPGYPAAWEETLRKSHRLSFAVSGPDAGTPSTLTLDVAPLVSLATGEVSRAIGIPLAPPAETLISVGQPQQKELTERLATFAPVAYLLAIGSAVALLLALVAARGKWTVLAAAGVGALLLAGLWAVGTGAGSAMALGTDTGNDLGNLFRDEFVPAAAASFQSWAGVTAVVGGVLLLAGVVAGVSSRRRAQPNR
jgi:hypothetical protein